MTSPNASAFSTATIRTSQPSPSSPRRNLHIPNAHPRVLSPRSRSGSPSPLSSTQVRSPTLPEPSAGPDSVASTSTQPLHRSATTPPASVTARGDPRRRRSIRRDGSRLSLYHDWPGQPPAESDENNHGPSQLQRHDTEAALVHDQSDGQADAAAPSAPTPNRNPLWRRIKESTRAPLTSADTARDFCARERTFLTWLRLSILLFILSGSLYLQVRLPPSSSSPASFEPVPTLVDAAHVDATADTPRSSRAVTSPLFAVLFLVLSLFTLAVGLVDYIEMSRDIAREQVSFDELGGGAMGVKVYVAVGLVATCLVGIALVLLFNA
ncbi:uncharacterized protein PFL1_01494 [Pseudozyma flocculosa PF-1]|uniref:DUF202 domain-containing protein n=1 Tax=Pseudozyma flocculosa TaxID=84751 RepID=A0A5C3FBF6_9BASI|nr:uncharacterized protein PFL1_01494 [Pseudozyma flocculosa PF-1]EPQ31309.1 hypothetical protein PFL1_01494 [Pseudozyma flocculosa PF-1]SPO41773.1 uncharacterized protein PSFLO_07255 [Pseudozyma flocculosa]